jgi:hypothetical protein
VCDTGDKKKSSSSFEESYCECIGLEYNPKQMMVQLRGAVNDHLAIGKDDGGEVSWPGHLSYSPLVFLFI